MQVLVTGATGFIGYHTVRCLRSAGHDVVALVRDLDRAQRILGDAEPWCVRMVEGDMTDDRAVARALDGCRGVVHAAATVAIGSGDPDAMLRDNLRGTELVVGGAAERGLGSIVYVSSLAALFDPRRASIDLDSPIAESRSPYGRSKAASERVVQKLSTDGAPIVTVYPGGVIGPEDPGMSESVYSYRGFTRRILATSGGVCQIDVRDLGELLARLVARARAGRVLAPGRYLTWYELARIIEAVTGATPGRIRVPAAALRGIASLVEGVNRLRGASSQFSSEGITIATRMPRTENSPELARLGIALRPAERTLEDMYRWLLAQGKLRPDTVPKLMAA